MYNIIEKYADFLCIQNPYHVEFRSIPHKEHCGTYWAVYSEKQRKLTHKIRIHIADNPRPINSVIAHELIHAWQEENGYSDSKMHGKEFRKMAKLISAKFKLVDVYIPGTDIN